MTNKTTLLVLLCIGITLGNIFITTIILHNSLTRISQLTEKETQLTTSYTQLNQSYTELNQTKNTLLALAVIEYKNTVKNISHHLDIIWEEKNEWTWIVSYRIPSPLFHIGETIRLLKHAHETALLYTSQDPFFDTLTRILCKSSLGDITRAFNLVYGHIHTFGVKLGEHEIDNELIDYAQNISEQIWKILDNIEANGVHPKEQLEDYHIQQLDYYFSQLNLTVTKYLQKPGTVID